MDEKQVQSAEVSASTENVTDKTSESAQLVGDSNGPAEAEDVSDLVD